ncbi:MAG: hypothetical protein R3D33_18800 [Hyphomicrobiaceae bacterium]
MRAKSMFCVAAATSVVMFLGGCAGPGMGPSGFMASGGGSCASLRADMNRLINRGVASKVDAQAAGRKLSPQAAAEVEQYNSALESYLGQGCQNQ